MDSGPSNAVPLGMDADMEKEYTSQSELLQAFAKIPNIEKAWTFKSNNGKGSQAMFLISQTSLLDNKNRKFILSAHIFKETDQNLMFKWALFPLEMRDASIIVPSPSGSKLLVVRNHENDSPTQFEIWGPSQLEKEYHIPQSIHGSVYTDGWFEGISWNANENLVAYVAEAQSTSKPRFGDTGFKTGHTSENDCRTWMGQGEWEEDWGETYAGKKHPALFVLNIDSGEVRAVEGIEKSLSAGQVIWAPSTPGLPQYLVFVGWPGTRKLGIKYCHNRPCALYAVKAPFHKMEDERLQTNVSDAEEKIHAVRLTHGTNSAFFPRFSPDGKFLVFISAKSAVNSGAHSATHSLHRLDWMSDGKLHQSADVTDVIPVVMCSEDDRFPGLYCASFLTNPWLSDGYTMILSSAWGSTKVILSVNILSGNIVRVSPDDSDFSWNVIAIDENNIIAVCSSPVNVPQIKCGSPVEGSAHIAWSWFDVSNPILKISEKVATLLSSLQLRIIKIPVQDVYENLPEGAPKPFEAIFVSSILKNTSKHVPLIVDLHGGPHDVALSHFSKSTAFLCSLGFSMLIVNYRGSLAFGEEALQCLPGKYGSQDVNDVLTAIDHIIDLGLADPSKIALLGISHGGFLSTHLIGQAPGRFAAAAVRNPVCNLASMVATSDRPDWCLVGAYGTKGKSIYTESPTAEHLNVLYNKSPISHISKVKTPTLFLLGGKDLRVPISNGLQYARALKEEGVEVKVFLFPNDIHEINRPQSDYESFLNIGVWFKKYCS